MRKLVSAFLAILVTSMALAGCSSSSKQEEKSAPAPTATPSSSTSKPAPPAKTTITVGLTGEPVTLDPQKSPDRLTNILLTNIFDSLVVHDAQMNLAPGLATEWKAIEPTKWQFKLRQGVKFQNGEPFDANAVKFTVERFLDPNVKSPMLANVKTITNVEVVDPYTVNLVTKGPDPILPVRMSELYGVMLPPKYFKEVGESEFAKKPIGTGPYKVAEWVKDERLVLEGYTEHWRGAPKLTKVTLRPIKEAASRVAALQTGEVDFINNVPFNQVEILKANQNLNVVTSGTNRVFFLTLDSTKKPFNDKKVRQAVNHAIDVEAIIKIVFSGYGKRVSTIVSPESAGFNKALKPYEYNIVKAKQLLAEAGYPNGLDITFDAFTGSVVDHSKLAEAIVGQLSAAGIRAKLNMAEFGVFAPIRVANKSNPMYIYSYGNWALDTVAVATLLTGGKSGYYYTHPDLTKLVADANTTVDTAARTRLSEQIQQHLYDEAAYGFLFQYQTVNAQSKALKFPARADEIYWFYDASF